MMELERLAAENQRDAFELKGHGGTVAGLVIGVTYAVLDVGLEQHRFHSLAYHIGAKLCDGYNFLVENIVRPFSETTAEILTTTPDAATDRLLSTMAAATVVVLFAAAHKTNLSTDALARKTATPSLT